MGIYRTGLMRSISLAQQNMYVQGALHPDRVMGEHDLVYMLEGAWTIRQDGTEHALRAGDVILLEAGRHHDGTTPCTPGTRTMFLHVSSDGRDRRSPSDVLPADEAGVDERDLFLPTVIHCQRSHGVKQLFEAIIAAFWSASRQKAVRCAALFELLLCELSECRSVGENAGREIDERLVQLIHRNPHRFFTYEEFAHLLHVPERAMRNRFKQLHHRTLAQYQLQVKLEQACASLRDHPDMRLADIAANLGFYDEFHFSKAFKKHFGMPPTRYRTDAAPAAAAGPVQGPVQGPVREPVRGGPDAGGRA